MEEPKDLFPWEGRIVVIKNLPPGISPNDIRDFLICKGRILRIDIECDITGQHNGLCYVEFSNPNEAAESLGMYGELFYGVHLHISIATSLPQSLIKLYQQIPSQRPSKRTNKITDESQLLNIYHLHIRRKRRRERLKNHHFNEHNQEEEEEKENESESYSFSGYSDSEYDL